MCINPVPTSSPFQRLIFPIRSRNSSALTNKSTVLHFLSSCKKETSSGFFFLLISLELLLEKRNSLFIFFSEYYQSASISCDVLWDSKEFVWGCFLHSQVRAYGCSRRFAFHFPLRNLWGVGGGEFSNAQFISQTKPGFEAFHHLNVKYTFLAEDHCAGG